MFFQFLIRIEIFGIFKIAIFRIDQFSWFLSGFSGLFTGLDRHNKWIFLCKLYISVWFLIFFPSFTACVHTWRVSFLNVVDKISFFSSCKSTKFTYLRWNRLMTVCLILWIGILWSASLRWTKTMTIPLILCLTKFTHFSEQKCIHKLHTWRLLWDEREHWRSS